MRHLNIINLFQTIIVVYEMNIFGYFNPPECDSDFWEIRRFVLDHRPGFALTKKQLQKQKQKTASYL